MVTVSRCSMHLPYQIGTFQTKKTVSQFFSAFLGSDMKNERACVVLPWKYCNRAPFFFFLLSPSVVRIIHCCCVSSLLPVARDHLSISVGATLTSRFLGFSQSMKSRSLRSWCSFPATVLLLFILNKLET